MPHKVVASVPPAIEIQSGFERGQDRSGARHLRVRGNILPAFARAYGAVERILQFFVENRDKPMRAGAFHAATEIQHLIAIAGAQRAWTLIHGSGLSIGFVAPQLDLLCEIVLGRPQDRDACGHAAELARQPVLISDLARFHTFAGVCDLLTFLLQPCGKRSEHAAGRCC